MFSNTFGFLITPSIISFISSILPLSINSLINLLYLFFISNSERFGTCDLILVQLLPNSLAQSRIFLSSSAVHPPFLIFGAN